MIHTATNTVADFFYLEAGNVHAVALSPDGARAYFLTNGNDLFGSDAGVVVLDTVTCAVIRTIVFGALPGQMALAPDGSRVYVGIQSVWVNTGYGAAFIPGRSVAVIDAITNAWVGSIDLGAAGAAWTLQNTAAGIAVAADRSDVYVAVPRLNAVAVIDTSTNVVRQLLPVGRGSERRRGRPRCGGDPGSLCASMPSTTTHRFRCRRAAEPPWRTSSPTIASAARP